MPTTFIIKGIVVKGVVALRRAPKGGLRHHASNRTFAGGQFIPAVLWEQQRQAGRDGLAPILAAVSDSLQFLRQSYQQNAALTHVPAEVLEKYAIPTIPLTTVEARLKTAIREAYQQAFLCGKRAAGNLTDLTPGDRKALTRTRRDEFAYLRGFLAAMRDGAGTMDYQKRMEMYAQAVRETYWLGFALADTSDKRRLRWVAGPTSDKCQSCLDMAAKGEMTAAEFAPFARKGVLPQSGGLDCKGFHCLCRLEEVGYP